MGITPDMRDMAMDLAATIAAEEIASTLGCDVETALIALLSSDLGEALYDDELKLWWESPSELAEAYLKGSATKPAPRP